MNVNNVSAEKSQAPQPARPVQNREASQNSRAPAGIVLAHPEIGEPLLIGKPTLHGHAPPGLERHFVTVAAGQLPEFCKLPAPRERCPFTGASRSWLIDQAEAGNIKLVRVRQPGKLRGAVFIHVPTLLNFLRRQMEDQS